MKFTLKSIAAVVVLAAVSYGAQAQQSNSAQASASATIFRPIAVAKNKDLAFGTLVKGAGTAVVSTAGARSVTGAVEALASTAGSVSQAQFTVTGEGGQSITITIPSKITIAKIGGSPSDTIDVTTSNDLAITGSGATQSGVFNLGGNLGDASDGSKVINIGGTLPLTATTVTGSYTGTFTVAANYN